jgi:AraC-like DNA-binding protein
MSSYREVAPEPRLRSLVAAVWAFAKNRHVHRVLPDGCMDIVLLNHRARVVGAMQSAITIPAKSEATLGIRLRPGEADRLFPGLASELTDSDALLTDLWGDDGRRLEDTLIALLDRATAQRLDASTMLREALPTVEKRLVDRLGSHSGAADMRTRVAASLLAQGASVADVAAHVNLSERQLSRRFVGRVGLSPKTFARVRRFQHAALLLKTGEALSGAAMLAGYADQPHFTREASALAGITPVGLAAELTDGHDTTLPVVL